MSVLIKGMKMPIDCPVCPLAHWNKLDRFTGCELGKRYFDKEDMETRGRPSFCPLVEIPPHGRLIDADALRQSMYHEAFETDSPMQKWDSGCWIRYKMFERLEGNAPTIIEAEGVSK